MSVNHESHEIFAQYGISEDTLYPKMKLFTSRSTVVDPIMQAINLQGKIYGEDPSISKYNRFSTSISRREIDGDIMVATFGNRDAGMECVESRFPSGFTVEEFTGGDWNIKVAAQIDSVSERHLLRSLQCLNPETQEEGINQLVEEWPILTINNLGKLSLNSEGVFSMGISKSDVAPLSSSEVKWEKRGIVFPLDEIYSFFPSQDIEAELGVNIRNCGIQEMIVTLGKGVRQRDLTIEELHNYVIPYIKLQEKTKV